MSISLQWLESSFEVGKRKWCMFLEAEGFNELLLFVNLLIMLVIISIIQKYLRRYLIQLFGHVLYCHQFLVALVLDGHSFSKSL